MSDTASPAKRLKAAWKKSGRHVSLRTFARELVKEGVPHAKVWFESKLGKNSQKQSEARKTHLKLVSSATKASRKPTGKK